MLQSPSPLNRSMPSKAAEKELIEELEASKQRPEGGWVLRRCRRDGQGLWDFGARGSGWFSFG